MVQISLKALLWLKMGKYVVNSETVAATGIILALSCDTDFQKAFDHIIDYTYMTYLWTPTPEISCFALYEPFPPLITRRPFAHM